MFLKPTKFPYVASLEIEHVKCFKEKQILKFTDENNRPYRWTVILGDNGTGKTTVLRSILMTVEGYYNHSRKQYLELLTINENSKLTIKYLGNESNDTDSIAFKNNGKSLDLIVKEEAGGVIFSEPYYGYGANRVGAKGTTSFYNREFDTGNLIDEDEKLIDVERYFLDADHFNKTKKTIKSQSDFDILKQMLLSVLPEIKDIRIVTIERNTRLEFQTPYGWVKFNDMSLGYRTITAWMVDLAVKMINQYPNSKKPLEQPAVVMVDEIDLHMHPHWQQKIISYLTEKFPRTQFIVTAHSPLIVQSATDANMIVLRRRDNQAVVDNDLISVKNWRIDQILSSDLFGISSRDLNTTQKLNRRRELLLREKLNPQEKKELGHLEKEVANIPTAESPEMIQAMEIIMQTARNLKK
jgi:predicted ATP-binding protein involved in virulence